VVKFRGVGITDEEIVYYKGEGSGVGVVAEEHGVEVLENPCWVRRATRRSWDKRPDWGRPGTHSLEDIAKEKRFAVGVAEKRKETKFGEGGKGNSRHLNADRLRRGKSSAKIVIDYVVSGDDGMEEGVDGGKGGCVGPDSISYNDLVAPYRSSHFSLSQSVYLIPLLLHHPLKIGGGFRGTHHRKEALEGDQ
jgi:hypothetical protein